MERISLFYRRLERIRDGRPARAGPAARNAAVRESPENAITRGVRDIGEKPNRLSGGMTPGLKRELHAHPRAGAGRKISRFGKPKKIKTWCFLALRKPPSRERRGVDMCALASGEYAERDRPVEKKETRRLQQQALRQSLTLPGSLL